MAEELVEEPSGEEPLAPERLLVVVVVEPFLEDQLAEEPFLDEAQAGRGPLDHLDEELQASEHGPIVPLDD